VQYLESEGREGDTKEGAPSAGTETTKSEGREKPALKKFGPALEAGPEKLRLPGNCFLKVKLPWFVAP
jgi:hypothetical protein